MLNTSVAMENHASHFDFHAESEKLYKKIENHAQVIHDFYQLPIRQCAVLVALFNFQKKPHVILTKRSDNLRQYSGHVSLPGGKVDPTDNDINDTALRETEEEIGLRRDHIRILGRLPPTYSPISNLVITAIVGFIPDVTNVSLNINEDEIESIFAVPLDIFLRKRYHDPSNTAYSVFWWDSQIHYSSFTLDSEEMETPFFKALFFDKHQKYKIWGLTAWVLSFYACLAYEINSPHIGLYGHLRYETLYENMAEYLKNLVEVYQTKGKLTSRL